MTHVLCSSWPECGCNRHCEAKAATREFRIVESILIGFVIVVGLAGGVIIAWSFYG